MSQVFIYCDLIFQWKFTLTKILFQAVNREGQAASDGRHESRLPTWGEARGNSEPPGSGQFFEGDDH